VTSTTSRSLGLLALEDGTVFRGEGFGADATATGEMCFNTGMTGYQEILTDPSYHAQIVAMTAPHIGNTGVNAHDDQSLRPWVAGFVMRDGAESFSSWRARGCLDDYLVLHGIPALSEVDTRRVTRHIRVKGAMRAALSTAIHDPDELVDVARASPDYSGRDLVRDVTTPAPYVWNLAALDGCAPSGFAAGSESSIATRASERELVAPVSRVAAFDYGVKRNALDLLVSAGCEVTVLPADAPADEVLDGSYDGVFLSNGPGDPEAVVYAVETVSRLLGEIPLFGICLGHQILALALGARTYKLPFGHRGSNHPVKRLDRDRVEITCQNHGFAVDACSLDSASARLTHANLNDGTVEGFEVPGAAFGVQFHPEAGPGPHDARHLFGKFKRLMARFDPEVVRADGSPPGRSVRSKNVSHACS
jgi:carbamoyl-phosphate synthase small subunit